MKYLHLDDEYKDRWEEYHLSNGTVLNSRHVNWRRVEWEKVVKLVASLNGIQYVIDSKDKPSFKHFVRYRWAGHVGPHDYRSWEIGWSDGETCYLKEIDFRTGRLIKEHTRRQQEIEGHIHPRVKIIPGSIGQK